MGVGGVPYIIVYTPNPCAVQCSAVQCSAVPLLMLILAIEASNGPTGKKVFQCTVVQRRLA